LISVIQAEKFGLNFIYLFIVNLNLINTMKNLHDLENLTIKEILIGYVGKENTEKILSAVLQGINEGMHGEELNKIIHETLCKLSITKIEVYLILQVIPRQVNP